MSRQPCEESGTCCRADVPVDTIGMTESRLTRTDDKINRGDAFARPEDINGVIPGAVDVADCH